VLGYGQIESVRLADGGEPLLYIAGFVHRASVPPLPATSRCGWTPVSAAFAAPGIGTKGHQRPGLAGLAEMSEVSRDYLSAWERFR
jgi:hypothetical protein